MKFRGKNQRFSKLSLVLFAKCGRIPPVLYNAPINHMSPALNEDLQCLFASFNATKLGEGDVAVGANLLATMACSIANIQRPGTGYIDPSGNSFMVGSSLLISGSHSSSLICEKVIQPMGLKQSNLASHILHSALEIQETKRKNSRQSSERDPFLAAVGGSQSLAYFYSLDLDGRSAASELTALLETDAPSGLGALSKNSYVFISGNSHQQTAQALEFSHMKRPNVHIGVDDVEGFNNFREVCSDIIDGRGTASVRGTVLLTDPCQALAKVIQNSEASAGLAQRMMWLVDGEAGPTPTEVEFENPPVAIDELFTRYEKVMNQAWGNRIAPRCPKELLTKLQFTDAQAEWMKFLKQHEPQHPGLSGAARGLFITLFYGFEQLRGAWKLPQSNLKWNGSYVTALAKFLVLRMINARSAMLASGENCRQLHVQMRILAKLAGQSHLERNIYRHLNLTAEVCKTALLALQSAGKVNFDGTFWSALGSSEPSDLHPLTLEA